MRAGGRFEVVSEYEPAGDQPAAIDELERRITAGERDVVLLGATGTGKSATTAWLVERLQRPTLVMAPNKTLAAQLANELREMLPHNAVEYFVSYYDYYQPEAYIAQTDTYIEKDSSINDDVERLRHSATSSLLSRARRGGGRLGVVHLRPRHPAVLYGPVGGGKGRGGDSPRCAAPAAGRRSVHPQRHGVHARLVPGARRHRRDHPLVRRARGAHRVLRRRGGGAVLPAPADRRRDPQGRLAADFPGDPLRRGARANGACDLHDRAGARGAAAPSWRSRASCSRRNGFGCGPTTTSR